MLQTLLTLLVCTAFVASTNAAIAFEPAAPPAVSLALRLTLMGDYDPEDPQGKLVCLARNNTDKPLTLPAEYDGGQLLLHGNRVTLHRYRPRGKIVDDTKTIVVEPQQEALLFELALADILEPREPIAAASATWYWTWMSRPQPPHSPIYQFRNEGYVREATFVVELHGDDRIAQSEPVLLKVKPSASSKNE